MFDITENSQLVKDKCLNLKPKINAQIIKYALHSVVRFVIIIIKLSQTVYFPPATPAFSQVSMAWHRETEFRMVKGKTCFIVRANGVL